MFILKLSSGSGPPSYGGWDTMDLIDQQTLVNQGEKGPVLSGMVSEFRQLKNKCSKTNRQGAKSGFGVQKSKAKT